MHAPRHGVLEGSSCLDGSSGHKDFMLFFSGTDGATAGQVGDILDYMQQLGAARGICALHPVYMIALCHPPGAG